MPRILLIKTSSLGDVVHNLPVVSDIHASVPDATIDWVVEEAFADIPRLHAGVARVIPVALRRWRKSLTSAETLREEKAFRAILREYEYDAVIDTQGLFKSALVARDARARRGASVGLDWPSSREPLRLFYDRTFSVPWGQHAVVRNRSLAAQALGYDVRTAPQYGIHAPQRELPWLPVMPGQRHAVLLHATSANPKLWPEPHWEAVSKQLFSNRMVCVLPWGSATEQQRSERLARAMPGALVPPRMSLPELAALFSRAALVIGVDTGLLHLAAALGTPSVGIYCDTDPAATGIHGAVSSVNLGGIGQPPSVDAVFCAAKALL